MDLKMNALMFNLIMLFWWCCCAFHDPELGELIEAPLPSSARVYEHLIKNDSIIVLDGDENFPEKFHVDLAVIDKNLPNKIFCNLFPSFGVIRVNKFDNREQKAEYCFPSNMELFYKADCHPVSLEKQADCYDLLKHILNAFHHPTSAPFTESTVTTFNPRTTDSQKLSTLQQQPCVALPASTSNSENTNYWMIAFFVLLAMNVVGVLSSIGGKWYSKLRCPKCRSKSLCPQHQQSIRPICSQCQQTGGPKNGETQRPTGNDYSENYELLNLNRNARV